MTVGRAEGFKAFEADGWTAQAGTYGGLTGAITSRVAESLLDAARVRADSRVLDVATGPGYVAERAVARGARVVGIDIAEGMLELGGFVVNHLPDPPCALAEAARVLVSGGNGRSSASARSSTTPPTRWRASRFLGVGSP